MAFGRLASVYVWLALLLELVLTTETGDDNTTNAALRRIFAAVSDSIEDCDCDVASVDKFNNAFIFPRLKSLLDMSYFRFFQVNLLRECPFWGDTERCSQSTCRVHSSSTDNVPSAIREHASEQDQHRHDRESDTAGDSQEHCSADDLGRLDTTVEQQKRAKLRAQAVHDSARHEFCQLDDASVEDRDQLVFVDLLRNPERYTGYQGSSANRVWMAIYKENCLKLEKRVGLLHSPRCLEERAFYKAVSGLHSSITVHLCAVSLLEEKCQSLSSIVPSSSIWGPNHAEFARRFDPETTRGEGPQWLKNLYFVYLLELRALQKVAPLLRQKVFADDEQQSLGETVDAVRDLLRIVDQFDGHFDETLLFRQRPDARLVFSQNFRNISRIMDCVSCDKCKLWGKLQTTGLGTALKILFSGHFDDLQQQQNGRFVTDATTFLSRNQLVALFNAFGRLSMSIRSLELFRERVATGGATAAHSEL